MASDSTGAYDLNPPAVYMSGSVDMQQDWDQSSVANKTVLITGGASGFGKEFMKAYAKLNATVVIGDLADATQLVEEVKQSSGNDKIYYFKLDVTDYKSQCEFFRNGKNVSPKSAIDIVIANAGVTELGDFVKPVPYIEGEDPPEIRLTTLDVNLKGVTYTTYLAQHYMRNHPHLSQSSYPNEQHDRSLLLIGSIASTIAAPGIPLYAATKHGVMGLFRSLRYSSKFPRIRVNILCPYFVDTPIVPFIVKALLSGNELARIEDVTDAGLRLSADYKVAGRALAVYPRNAGGIMDIVCEDMKDVEPFTRRVMILLNEAHRVAGWSRFLADFVSALWRVAMRRSAS